MRGPERYGSRDLNKTELKVVELVVQGLKNSEVARDHGYYRDGHQELPSRHLRQAWALESR